MVVPRDAAERVLGLENRIRDELTGVFVRQPIEDARAVLPGRDDPSEAKLRQMLRNGCRRLLENVGQKIDRQLLITQGEDDAHPRRIRQHAEDLDRQLDVLTVGEPPAYLVICIHTQIIALTGPARQCARHYPGSMCASYGLDPRFSGYEALAEADQELVAELREWARQNASETIRPTGKNLRNLNALIRGSEEGPHLERAWWGYLVGGEPAKFPSINTRSERLQERPGGLAGRAIVPATNWLEMQKPSRDWYSFGLGEHGEHELFGMAAVTQQGRPTGGDPVTCYSIVMQPAAEALTDFHDRMPLLIPADFAEVWLDPAQDPTRELIDAALDASRAVSERVGATRLEK